MTLDETVRKIEKRTGMKMVPKDGQNMDLADPGCWRIEYNLVSPTGFLVLEIGLSRYHDNVKDDGWKCGMIGFPCITEDVNAIIEN